MNEHSHEHDSGVNPDTLGAIEAATDGLAYLDSAPTASHVAVFEHVHLTLTDALAAIDGV